MDDLLETFGRYWRLASFTPVIAHLAFEIASVEDLHLYIEGRERSRMQDCPAHLLSVGFYHI
jgi:hypothetical protein